MECNIRVVYIYINIIPQFHLSNLDNWLGSKSPRNSKHIYPIAFSLIPFIGAISKLHFEGKHNEMDGVPRYIAPTKKKNPLEGKLASTAEEPLVAIYAQALLSCVCVYVCRRFRDRVYWSQARRH